MTGGSKLVAISGDEPVSQNETRHQDALPGESVAPDDGVQEWTEAEVKADDWETAEPGRSRNWAWIAPTFALAAIIAWTAFFGWAHRAQMLAGGSALEWSQWITAWAIPVLLVISLWLLAMRSSKREAGKFADAANALSAESALLETRLITVNRELSLAREFLGSQSRELESLGRVAGERLSGHADRLQQLVRDNGSQVEAIAAVSDTALENMDKLRNELPVIANSARDVSNQIGGAGRTARAQLDDMIGGFERLNDFGQASERQVAALRAQVDDTLTGFQAQTAQMGDLTTNRFAVLREQSDEFRTSVAGHEVELLAAIRHRAAALDEQLGDARSELETTEEQAMISMRARLSGLRDETRRVTLSVRESEEAAIAAWSNQIEALQTRLSQAVAAITRIDETALESSNKKLQELLAEAELVDTKLAERDELFWQTVDERRETLYDDEKTAAARLEGQLGRLDEALAIRREAELSAGEDFSNRAEAIAATLDNYVIQIAVLAEQGTDTERLLAGSVAELTQRLADSRQIISGTDTDIAALTESSVRLLELVRGTAERAREDLPLALGNTEAQLSGLREQVDAMRAAIDDTSEKSRSLSDYVIAAKDDGEQASAVIAGLHAQVDDAGERHREQIGKLHQSVIDLGEESDRVSTAAKESLREAVASLQQAVRNAAGVLTDDTSVRIRGYATKVGNEAADTMDLALRGRSEEAIAQLEEHAVRAATINQETTDQLSDQLAKVDELASNLEMRIARAREQAEEQVDNDFSRRVSLITESLNSNAIDISKALSDDVSDTAWTSYLRGDRGIFTRRAVTLLNNNQARDIAEIYDTDQEFREYVSRYIHDFESMLRTMLSTRDGNALGVTVLSSDMGKLYVALAQAIERLRE